MVENSFTMEKILLVAPPHMNLYKDVENGLRILGMDVTSIIHTAFPNDPYFINNPKSKDYDERMFQDNLKNYWESLFISKEHSWIYDFLLVINGAFIHHCLFEKLRSINPNIICINYIFDNVTRVYNLQRNFKYFDRIFTFDRSDAEALGLTFLPNYWMKIESKGYPHYDVFGFGSYNKTRYQLFREIDIISKKLHKSRFIKLYTPPISGNVAKIKNLAKCIVGENAKIKRSGLLIHKFLEPEDFRQYILSSDIIIDTCNPLQDGLTPRFMWALGTGKKIITDNKSVREYKFYDPRQIMVIDDSKNIIIPDDFFQNPFYVDDEYYNKIGELRIDNWLKEMLYP